MLARRSSEVAAYYGRYGGVMPGNQVKNWPVYHKCMEGKKPTPANKTKCSKVANSVGKSKGK